MPIAPVSMTASPGSLRRLKTLPAKASCASTGKCWTPGGVLSASATSTCGALTNATGRSGLPTPSDSLQLLRAYLRPSTIHVVKNQQDRQTQYPLLCFFTSYHEHQTS